jgi:hypothetical protein
MSAAWLLALALTQQAAPAWRSLGTHEGIDTAYDPASLRRIGEHRLSVRIRGIIATPGPDTVKTATGTLEIDCAAGIATAVDVRAENADGGLIINALMPPAERVAVPIRPASPNAAVRDAVCGTASGQ